MFPGSLAQIVKGQPHLDICGPFSLSSSPGSFLFCHTGWEAQPSLQRVGNRLTACPESPSITVGGGGWRGGAGTGVSPGHCCFSSSANICPLPGGLWGRKITEFPSLSFFPPVFFQPHSNFVPFLRAVSSSWGFHLCRLWHSSLLSSPLPQWPSFPVHLMKALESLAPSCPPAQCGMESLHHPENTQHPLSRSLLSLVSQFRPSGTLPAGLRAMGTEPWADPAGK